jgi:outer membrane receptor protein involved in Fe transport
LAGFALLDLEIIKQVRVSGGLRVENAKIFSDVLKYHNLGYERNDIRRENVGGFPNANAANIDETAFLPSVNLIYKIKKESFGKMNIRANFSQTVARPSIRELNDIAVFDNEFRTLIYGNSDLKTVQIKNYDFRAESFFNNGDNVSFSLFYKDFTNHIEMGFGNSGITWQNIENSNVVGFEFEGKKKITKFFDIKANVTLVNSQSEFVRKSMDVINGEKIYTPIDTVMRPMFGQAPYIINAIASYKSDSLGLTATLSYNIQGPRLVITGVVKGRPDVYELPRNTIDFKVSKTLGKHFSTSLTIRDILNAPVVRAYKLPTEWLDFDRFRYGTNFVLGVSYKL